MALHKGKVITLTSVKGGSGKTTTLLNIAHVLSKKSDKVVIVDLDLYFGAISTSLNINTDKDVYTIYDDMVNNRFENIEDYVYKYNNISIISSPIDPRKVNKITAEYVDLIISRLEVKYDYILIDTNHTLSEINLTILDKSDLVLYVMTNDLIDIKSMKTMVSIYKDMERDNYEIILNLSLGHTTKYDEDMIKKTIERDIDYIIPKYLYNKNIEKCIYEGKINTANELDIFEKIIKDL